MCPNYTIGLNETRLGIIAPIFLRASLRNTISQREAEQALTLGTLYSTDEAFKVQLVIEKIVSEFRTFKMFADWTRR